MTRGPALAALELFTSPHAVLICLTQGMNVSTLDVLGRAFYPDNRPSIGLRLGVCITLIEGIRPDR